MPERCPGFVDDEATRSYLVPSLISLAVVLVAAFIRQRAERPSDRRPAEAEIAGRRLGGVR